MSECHSGCNDVHNEGVEKQKQSVRLYFKVSFTVKKEKKKKIWYDQ